MRKLLKNNSASFIKIRTIGLRLSPGQIYEINKLEETDYINDTALENQIIEGNIQVGSWEDAFYTDPYEGLLWLKTQFDDNTYTLDGTTLVEFTPAIVTDTSTGKKSSSLFMNIMTMMKEFYNDPSNPVYHSGFQKFIGTGGREEEHLARTLNCETIHSKLQWHQAQVTKAEFKGPRDLLVYYGYLNSFNSGINGWDNEKVAQEMSKYGIIIVGSGVANPTHPDYANTQIIIPRIKVLNPNCLIFGYVDGATILSTFQTAVDQWNTLQVHGIFVDQAGYDFGTTATNSRTAMNTKVDYIHSKTYSKLAFMNSWNMDHNIGTANDVSYPNTTWNAALTASTLTNSDWILLESFPVNSAAYATPYIETASDWNIRGQKAINHRATYGINLAAVGIIGSTLATNTGQNLFDFLFMSALMFSLEAVGSSDDGYAASSVTVKYWTRKDVSGLKIFSYTPTVTVSASDANVYTRFIDDAIISINFGTTVVKGYIYKSYDQYIANRKMTSDPYVCQPFMARKSIGCWSPIGNSTTVPIADGIAAPTGSSATARTTATTNLFTSMRRLGYVGATSAGSSTGPRLNVLQYWRGNAVNLGGFMLVIRFGVSDAATVAQSRTFVGMCGVTTALSNANPSTFTNIVGVGNDSTQTTLRILYNDASGTASSIDLGANFPSNTLSTDIYELVLFCEPNSSVINYRVERLNTGHVATGTLTTDLPANTQLLAPQLWRNNGSTALAVGIDLISLYIETEF